VQQPALIVLKQFAKDLGSGDELWRHKLLVAEIVYSTPQTTIL
jgi:hypothetical protein